MAEWFKVFAAIRRLLELVSMLLVDQRHVELAADLDRLRCEFDACVAGVVGPDALRAFEALLAQSPVAPPDLPAADPPAAVPSSVADSLFPSESRDDVVSLPP